MAASQKLREAVNALQSHSQTIQAIMAVADEIKTAEDLNRLTGEANSELKKRTEELAAAQAEVDKAKAQLDRAKKGMKAAEAAIPKAEEDAAAIIAKAKEQAAKLVSEGSSQADGAREAAKEDVKVAAKEAAARRSVIKDLDGKIARAEKELASLNERIEEARDTIRRMING